MVDVVGNILGVTLTNMTWHQMDNNLKRQVLQEANILVDGMKDFNELSPLVQKKLIIAYRRVKNLDIEPR